MSKDQYSGAPRKTSGVRRGTRDRIVPPSYGTKTLGGELPAKDADDALSGELVRAGVIAPRQPQSISKIRQHIENNTEELLGSVIRAGESAQDAGNAIRARMNRKLVPTGTFVPRKGLRGRSGLGKLDAGTKVRVTGVKVRNGALRWTISGRTSGGRAISNDVHDDVISGLF